MNGLRVRGATLALGAGALVIGASSAAVALGARGAKVTSYAYVSPGVAVLASLTGAAVLATAVAIAASRRTLAALATFALGCVWSADVWAGWANAPTLLRNLGMLLAPMLAAFALLVIATSLLPRSRARQLAVAFSAAGIAAAIVLWLVRDPYLDRYCWRDCLAHPLAPVADPELARTTTNLTLVLGAFCGVLAAVLCARRLAQTGDRVPVLLVGLVSGCALAARDGALRLEPAEDPTALLYVSLFVVCAVALLALAASVGYLALRPWLVRRQIAALAAEPDRSGGGLEAALAAALDDPQLRVGYPLTDDGPVVDASGSALTFAGRPARIVRGGEVIALVGSPAGTPSVDALERALGSAARLALSNERLRAEESFRLYELTQLRRRVVATGDETRRRLERDLHDGAQQRLLALAIDLQVALKHARAAPEAASLIRAAVERVAAATAELRRVAHGIFPSTLANAGLVAALESLADERRLALSNGLEPGRRFPAEIEAAAYALAAETTVGAARPVRLSLREDRSALVVTLTGATLDGGGAEERIGAAGGTLAWSDGRLEAVLPVPAPSAYRTRFQKTCDQ
jgi:signal transduction histidine kinase